MPERINGKPNIPDAPPVPDTTEKPRRVEEPEKPTKVDIRKQEPDTVEISEKAREKLDELYESQKNPDNIEEENTVSDPEGLKTRRDEEETEK